MTALTQFAESVDNRFDAVDGRFDRLEGDVAELKTDVAELKIDVTDLKENMRRVYSILDAHMARIERILEENAVQTRMQRWIFQLADQAGIKLKYE